MHPLPTDLPPRRTHRRGRAALLASAVLMLHVLALDAAETGPVALPQGPVPLSVRLIEAPPEAPAVVVAPEPVAPPRPRALPAPRPRPPALAQVAQAGPAPAPEQSDRPAPTAEAPVPPPAPAASGPIPPEAPVPVYKTRIAPPMTLRYELRRGGITGNGELQWAPQGKHYELRLEGKVAGFTLLTQVSEGEIDAHGLAPTRFTDQRTRRAAQAANFQRDKGVISFSGPPEQYVLVPGVQDRLSWMLQLGAIVSAEPGRAKGGQKVSLYVVGSRGEVDTWVMDFAGTENVQGTGGTVRAVKFEREPRKPNDSHIEIWLDPARNHLPVHARQANGDGGDVFELLLREGESAR
jgi:hypothetical protein